MGGSGRGFFHHTTPEELREKIRAEEEKTASQEFENTVSEALGELLTEANRRDTAAVETALNNIKTALRADIDGDLEPILGGSARKHTYVDGISDIDALMILKDEKLGEKSPAEVLKYFENRIRRELSDWEVSPHGPIAVTLRKGAMEIQILPGIRRGGALAIPSGSGNEWSKINPEKFYARLTRANKDLGGKLIPVIKLAKVINDSLPDTSRLTGYHIESLAIQAFKKYGGAVNSKAMLKHFFDSTRNIVLAPIRDSTGQSVHVDEYMGPANSAGRKVAAAALDRVYRQMRNADAILSVEAWVRLFGDR